MSKNKNQDQKKYQLKNSVRIVTAASLFDGHDASINIMRRILQDMGAEVIHLGHNRSVKEVVDCALQEGAQGIAISSYQGGHMEYFKYMRDLLDEAGANYVKIFGGGGGVIVYDEKKELEAYGISQIFHPDDGRKLGLEGMIEMIIRECDYDVIKVSSVENKKENSKLESPGRIPQRQLGLELSQIEKEPLKKTTEILGVETGLKSEKKNPPIVLGITGTGGAGKSSLIDELITRFLHMWPEKNIAVVCVDPSKRKTGGSLLGDRIRMNSLSREGTFMRSVASRNSTTELASALPGMLEHLKNQNFDFIIAETSGIGQANVAITEVSDLSLYVMTSEFGAQSQLEKIDMIDFADVIAINKADRRGAEDALRDVRKQYARSRKRFHDDPSEMPVYLTQAAQFNDSGANSLFFHIVNLLSSKNSDWKLSEEQTSSLRGSDRQVIVPPERQNYLAEVVSTIRKYKKEVVAESQLVSQVGALEKSLELLGDSKEIESKILEIKKDITAETISELDGWDKLQESYAGDEFSFFVRGKEIKQSLITTSLSGLKIKKVSLPKITDWGDRLKFLRLENVPGSFPFTAGVFPLKREGEDPKRMFAGEGTPERTNKRFHYLSKGEPVTRLSTAFDSVTLYGQDPDKQPDIYGKVGESGVSICSLVDLKKLYSGFDLSAPTTSVSMTINGPAPMLLAFYLNAAIDQNLEKKIDELGLAKVSELSSEQHDEVFEKTLQAVRGTVQADILKEDQGQNTCIFSIDFALKMMGDIQQYFTDHKVRNFYSVSISGYHIAEAGANPISQLAFTLSNALTYVEYYLSRGMNIDEFAGNLSFFFSNGLEPEYSVLGRVARRVWAVAIKNLYKGNERSQKLKYHIQTSGRSLHAQEIDFNDIRTTLQALLALYDNCNSLHTNAYDEAITTPTEESVRRAVAIQMIISKEFGAAKNENPVQGSYFFEELTDLVEEAVLDEFLRINERGGVLGAMETQYQRGKIQEESLYYESLKHNGKLPIVGVNTFINPSTLIDGYEPPKIELARASVEEKKQQLDNLESYQDSNSAESSKAIEDLKSASLKGENIFSALMVAARYCSLYQMTQALYEVGGKYRRNL